MNLSLYEILDFPVFRDKKGDTIPFELTKNFPFEVKRVYIVTANDGAMRGGHAHKIEEEIFIAINGEITAIIHDGEKEEKIKLNQKNKGLWVKTNCWHEFRDFSQEALLLCFSSTPYLPGDSNYIMDRHVFWKNT